MLLGSSVGRLVIDGPTYDNLFLTRGLISARAEGLGLEKESEDESKGDIREEAGGTCLWGIQLMLNPVVKRFRYHFMSKRPTNNIEKVVVALSPLSYCSSLDQSPPSLLLPRFSLSLNGT